MTTSYRAAQTLIKRGDEPALRAALTSGLDANATNPNGWSLLMLAAVEGRVPIGQALIDHGANMAALNRTGDSPLDIATKKGHTDFIALLQSPI